MRTPRPTVTLALSFAVLVVLTWAFTKVAQGEASRRQLWSLGQTNYHEFREKLEASQLPHLDVPLLFGRSRMESAPVRATPAGAVSDGPIMVELEAEGTIYYSLDGSIPTDRSATYSGPLRLDSTTVVRARTLRRGSIPGPVGTWHFVVGHGSAVSVTSIATDPAGLWNKYAGIYANATRRGRAWEREAHIGYLPRTDAAWVGIPAEIRIHGGYSRLAPKKSLRMRYSDAAVASLPDTHVLRRSAFDSTVTVVIRGDAGSHARGVRDALASVLYEGLGGMVTPREATELFLNGRYWGVYHLHERVDAGFLQSRLGAGSYELLTHDSENAAEWLTPVLGTRDGWDETMHQLRTSGPGTPAGNRVAAQLIDLDNTLDYWIHHIYTANLDWPYNNVHLYRRVDGQDRRWKWVAWDLDAAFARLDHNTLAWSLRDRIRNDLKWNFAPGAFEDGERNLVSTEPIRILLANEEFRSRFIARAQVLIDLYYTEERIGTKLDSIVAATASTRSRDAARWGWADTTFQNSVESIRDFVRERPSLVRRHIARHFSLGEPVEVRIETAGPGVVRVDGFSLPPGGATLTLLRGTTVRITARADSGAVLGTGPPADTVLRVTQPAVLDYRFSSRGAPLRSSFGPGGRSRPATGLF